MQVRKKQIIDGIDKEILRALYKKGPLVSREISFIVGLTPSSIKPRLNNLKEKGIIKNKDSKIRVFRKRSIKNKIIKSPRKILWSIDLKK